MKKTIQILLFIFLGIPGALFFVFASIGLVGKVFDPRADLPDSHTLLLACVIGIVATLIGIGKFKQWLYSFVFVRCVRTICGSGWLKLINSNVQRVVFNLMTFNRPLPQTVLTW